MFDHGNQLPIDFTDRPAEATVENVIEAIEPARTEVVPAEESNGESNGVALNRHVEAGRLGARRVHQLIQLGKLYEKEHGLTRGRQRLRQLLEEGKLYEQEHGLAPKPARKRGGRVSSKQVVRRLLDVLVRIAKPSFRPHLLAMLDTLERTVEQPATDGADQK